MSNTTSSNRAPWIVTPLIAVACFIGIFALTRQIDTEGWLTTAALLLLIATVAVIATRALTRSRFLPTLVGALIALVALIPAFARTEEGERRILPTPGAFMDLVAAINEGILIAATSAAPVEPSRPFIALVVTSLVVLFLLTEHLAVSWRLAATAGFLLVLPWLPALIFQYRVPIPALLTVVGLWLMTLALTKRGPVAERSPSFGAALTATTATVAVVLMVIPTALGGNGWGMLPRLQTPDTVDTATRLNLALDLRNSLTTRSQSPILTYATSGQRPDILRLYALTDFDGNAWSRREPVLTERPATTGVLWPQQVEDWSQRPRERLDIQIESLAEDTLPLPATPRSVNVSGNWFYNAELDEVTTTSSTGTQGLRYEVISDLDYHRASSLQAAQDAIDAGVRDITDPRYLELDPSIDLPRIQGLATSLTANATSRYEQAVALQQYLRDPQEFIYDVTVSPGGGDSVSTFLDDRRGYCVQFGTAMVVMARSLDIPARLAIGFLPGRPTSADNYVVVGGDAHAWPELYFPDHGWVRFEPTPSIQTGAAPEWANPFANQVPVPRDILEGGQTAPAPLPQEPGLAPDAPAELDEAPATPWWVWAAIAGAALITVVAIALWRRARVATAKSHEGPEGMWLLLREKIGDDFAWPPTFTPHEAAEHVEARMRLYGYGLTGAARESLTKLSNAVSDHRYAPHGSSAQMEELEACVEAVVTEVNEAKEDESKDRPARDGARSAPRRGA